MPTGIRFTGCYVHGAEGRRRHERQNEKGFTGSVRLCTVIREVLENKVCLRFRHVPEIEILRVHLAYGELYPYKVTANFRFGSHARSVRSYT